MRSGVAGPPGGDGRLWFDGQMIERYATTTTVRAVLGWPVPPEQVPTPLGWPSSTELPAPVSRETTTSDTEQRDVSRETAAVTRDTRQTPDQSMADNADSLVHSNDPSRDGDAMPLEDAALQSELFSSDASQSADDEETPLAALLVENARRSAALVDVRLPAPPHPRVLTVANQKGGVGKTTTAVNVAASLAMGGLQVLVIDLDPQGNASTALGIDHHAEIDSIYDVLVEEMPLQAVAKECPDIPGLWCAPSTIDLAGAEIELVSLVARESRLKRAIEEVVSQAHYDYVLIDCPPSLGLLTVNAFVAANEILIPIQCEYYALEGLSLLLKNIELIRSHLNPKLHVSTILLTMYDGRTRLSSQVAEEVRAHFPDQVLQATVPRSVRVSEAPGFGQTVITYDPASSGALSYREAAAEVAHRAFRTISQPTPRAAGDEPGLTNGMARHKQANASSTQRVEEI